MRFNIITGVLLSVSACSLMIGGSCSKGGGGGGTPNPCSGVTITVNGTTVNASSPTASDGSIAASASGGSGFTFSINGGAFQSSGNFSGLATGAYTVAAKDSRGCSGSKAFTITSSAGDPCTGQTFTVSGGTPVGATPCASPNGSITVSTNGGGAGFTYNLNNGAFQSSPVFNNLAAGDYTVGAKEAGGCIKTANVTVPPKPAGPLFLAVKAVITANCAVSPCHNGTQNPNFTVDCNIVANALLIKARAVDAAGTPNQMPQPPNPALSQADQNKITNWVNAGGLYTN